MSYEPSFSFMPHPEHPQVERLLVDGKMDEGSIVNMFLHERRSVYLSDPDVIGRLCGMRCSDLVAHFVSTPTEN